MGGAWHGGKGPEQRPMEITDAEMKANWERTFGPKGCNCAYCRPNTIADMRMILCGTCGNKRCPHATHHNNACTGSNEPGQPGSAYE